MEYTPPDEPVISAPIVLNIEDLNGRVVVDEDGVGFQILDPAGHPVVELRPAAFHPDRSAVTQGISRFSAQLGRFISRLDTPQPTRELAKRRNARRYRTRPA